MNKPVYFGISTLELSKKLFVEFRWNCVKPKCREKIKLSFMETYSFTIYIKIDDIYIKILQNVLKQGFALQIVN